MYEVIFYKDKYGNEPLKNYIYEMKRKGIKSKTHRIIAEKILTYIKVLQEYGTRIGTPIVKHIDQDIWELRPLNNRILFFYWKDDTFVLLHYFTKKTRKTPMREIEKAKKNLKEFIERME